MQPTGTHTVQDVKTLRQDIDALVLRVESAFASSRELSLVKTKLEEAKMWAGKELGNLGQLLPAEFADNAPVNAPVESAVETAPAEEAVETPAVEATESEPTV